MKKKLFLVAILALILTLAVVADTYGLFETNAVATKDLDIGQWVITVNNVDVTTSQTITLSNFNYTSSQHVDSGYFAPGLDCWFDVVLDMSGAEVSVAYDLEIDDSQLDDYPNIYFSITDLGTNQSLTSNTYSGVSLLSDSNRVVTLRIYINWDDDPLYDETDSTLIDGELSFTIDANFLQYLGV